MVMVDNKVHAQMAKVAYVLSYEYVRVVSAHQSEKTAFHNPNNDRHMVFRLYESLYGVFDAPT